MNNENMKMTNCYRKYKMCIRQTGSAPRQKSEARQVSCHIFGAKPVPLLDIIRKLLPILQYLHDNRLVQQGFMQIFFLPAYIHQFAVRTKENCIVTHVELLREKSMFYDMIRSNYMYSVLRLILQH